MNDDEFGALLNAALHRRHPPEPEPGGEDRPARPGPADAGAGGGSPPPSFGAQLNAALREPRRRSGRLEVW